MCGIGLIVSGLELPSRLLHRRTRTQTEADTHTQKQSETDGAEDKEEAFDEGQIHQVVAVSAENLIEVLERRGPNFIRKHTVFLKSKELDYDDAAMGEKQSVHLPLTQLDKKISQLKLEFVAATLQLRGASVTLQPLMDECNNVLVYNGEIFGGLPVKTNENDSQCLFESLCRCCFCVCHMKSPKTETCICIRSEEFGMTHVTVPEILSSIKGPWALIFWQAKSRTLWFGRDAFGRRSLLVHWPSRADQRLVFSSVSPTSNMPSARNDVMFEYWEELHCGIYSCSIQASAKDCYEAPNYGFEGRLEEHPWEDKGLARMVAWERSHVLPPPEFTHDRNSSESRRYMLRVLSALRESVRRRTSNIFKYDEGQMTCLDTSSSNAQTSMVAPVAVLFSGGLDSMILSSILDQCLPPPWSIDLLNVSFGGPSAPDRISAIAGVKELSKVSPSRSWRLVEVDGDLSSLGELQDHLLSLICPSRTYMDLNIGTALWLAAEGRGWVKDSTSVTHYTSDARVILVGSGADEQCAGYGRHRTKFREGGWETLDREMKLDVQRLWKRNMGRDDRCIGDHGKEARFPFLDEDVIQSLVDIPLWYIADLREPSGQGDKKILREIAVMLGLTSCASLPKRAIQFGTRIAQESNRKIFGSNRAANQASAGSAPLHCFEGHVKVDDV